jgi:hypothetical protein
MPPEGQSPVKQRYDDDEYNSADGNNGYVRQSKHYIRIVCGMLTYNVTDFTSKMPKI